MEKFPHLLQSLKILHDRQYRKIINSKIQDKIRYKFIIQITITRPWKECNKIFSSSWKRHRQSLIVLHNRDRTSSIVHYIVAYTAHDSPAKAKTKTKTNQYSCKKLTINISICTEKHKPFDLAKSSVSEDNAIQGYVIDCFAKFLSRIAPVNFHEHKDLHSTQLM